MSETKDQQHPNNNNIDDKDKDKDMYQTGFGNTFESQVLTGALPVGQNNPRLVPYNLYTEQLSGTAFTAPRCENRRVWLYRIQPSVVQQGDTTVRALAADEEQGQTSPCYFGGCAPQDCQAQVNPLRWRPFPTIHPAHEKVDFVQGMQLMCHGGDPSTKHGLAIYMYSFGASMKNEKKLSTSHTQPPPPRAMYNADGDFLLVPQQGTLEVVTEMGKLLVEPCEICVIPRGMVFQINLESSDGEEEEDEEAARGYVLEIYNGGFQLPELGPIGSNGLANARDFLYPKASCVSSPLEYKTPHQIVIKMDARLYEKTSPHSPFNVVAWHGNYLPYKYDLRRFCAVNSVTYDHLDPSIYTVLTCQTDHAGTALADFVIFPPRIMATDPNTFRPPWFHRNTMSEFMGLIQGKYDAKEDFVAGGASLHNCMTPHGPDTDTYNKATNDPCDSPTKFDGGLAFMFETCLPLKVAPAALENPAWREMTYAECWQGLADNFTGWDALQKQQQKKK
uniref:homogentisate 1,2-dioxygenase n=1 Tax=Amphora coffeiformis TaxID=265554 RepID=A0A7S3KWR8_9STRA|mmetsp:Transcript_1770/g.3888  ORF Transcript_1770/g.3888 Transcript_1770/m.3888 type:complete len:505 (-) Transcript_1770:26-1540(-)|eukprot:scaffold45177_cov260-Amphora_coffeaeformis.AAC.3